MSEKALGELEVWLVAGTQDLYGPEVIATVEQRAREVAAALDASPALPVGVRSRGAVRSADEIERVCLEANAAASCAGLIVWMHTFSPAKMWIAGLSGLRKPLLHLHTQFEARLPWAEIDMAFMNLNQSAHGDRELGALLTRAGVRRATAVGHWADPMVRRRIGTWARAAAGWHALRRLRVARFGDNMREVAVTEGDKVEAQLRLGVSVNGYPVGDLADAVAGAEGVEDLAREYGELYDVAPALRGRPDALREAARIELGLRAYLDQGGFHAFTDTFEDLGALRQLPGIAVQRLMADGFGFGAEGDWKTAALLRALKVMAAGLDGGTSFMEDYAYDFEGEGLVLGAHMLEICPSLAAGRPSCEIHPLSIGAREDPVRLVFTAREGPAVNVALVDLGDRFRLLLNEVDVVAPPTPLRRLPVAHAVWRPRPTLALAAERWLEAGGPHHTVLSLALDAAVVRDFARIADVELVEIG